MSGDRRDAVEISPLTGALVNNLNDNSLVVLSVGDLHALVAALELVHSHSTDHGVNGGTVRGKTVAIVAGSVLQVVARVPKI